MIKKFNKYNESVRDKMTPKSEAELDELVKELSPEDLFQKGDWDDDEWMMKLAIDKGLDLYSNNKSHLKAIIRQNHVGVLKHVLEKGVDMQPTTDFDPYYIAACNGWNKIIKLLIKYNVRITKRAVTTAHVMDHISTYTLLKEYFDKQQERTNESLRDQMTPKSREDIIGSLGKLSPYYKIKMGAIHNFTEVVKQGLDEIDKDLMKESDALHYIEMAIQNKNVEMAKLFLDNNKDDIKHKLLNSYLITVIQKYQNLDMVKLFHEYGADLDYLLNFRNVIDRYVTSSETPNELVKYLVANSSNINSYVKGKYKQYNKLRKFYGNYVNEKVNESIRDKMTPKSLEEIWNSINDLIDDGYKLSKTLCKLLNDSDSVYQRFWQDEDVIHEMLLSIPDYKLDLRTVTSVLKEADSRLAFGIEHIYVPIWNSLPVDLRKETLKNFIEKYKI